MVVDRSSSDDSAIRPILCTFGFVNDIKFSHNGANGPETITMLCFVEFARWRHRGEVVVCNCMPISSGNFENWPAMLSFELDLTSVKENKHAKYISQRSSN